MHASSEGQKLARSSVQSNYPLKYLSPKSRSIRVGWITKERKNLGAKLSSVAHFDVSDQQHAELLKIVHSVCKNGSKAVEELCTRGDQLLGQEYNPLREVWQQDVAERIQCEKDQLKSGGFSIVDCSFKCTIYYLYIVCNIFQPSKPLECHYCENGYVKHSHCNVPCLLMIVFLPYSSCCFHQKPSCFRGSLKLQAHAAAFRSYTEALHRC